MVPTPPDVPLPVGGDIPVTIFMATLLLIAFSFALFHWQKSGRPIVMLLFLAGGCMCLLEPMVDTVGGCFFPPTSMIAYWGWGRPMPIWLCLTYFAYFGVGSALIWLAMKRGASRKTIWLIFLGEMATDFILETILLKFDLYTYYGFQPLMVGQFPMWWAAVNALISVTAATVVFFLAQHLKGWKLLAIIPALLSTSAAVNAAAGWPSWFVVNTDVGPILTQVGGLATFALAFGVIHTITVLVCKPSVSRLPFAAQSA